MSTPTVEQLMKDLVEIEKVKVPSLKAFRKYVDSIYHERNKLLIKALYLTASRVSEMLTKTTPWDLQHRKTKPFGRFLYWELTDWDKEKVLLINEGILKRGFSKKTTKQKLVRKIIALPCNPKYEPWTTDLLKYIKRTGSLTFPFTRTHAWRLVTKSMASLDDRIKTHSLRHFRLTHLRKYYRFDPAQVVMYAGWTFKSGLGSMGGAGQLDTYMHIGWGDYFKKLLRKIP